MQSRGIRLEFSIIKFRKTNSQGLLTVAVDAVDVGEVDVVIVDAHGVDVEKALSRGLRLHGGGVVGVVTSHDEWVSRGLFR